MRKPAFDIIVPQAPTTDGKGARGLRFRPDGTQPVLLQPLVNGMPIPPSGSMVRMRPRPDGALDVIETLYESQDVVSAGTSGGEDVDQESISGDEDVAGGALQGFRAGPPKVTSDEYRAGYDAIDWGGGRPVDPQGAN